VEENFSVDRGIHRRELDYRGTKGLQSCRLYRLQRQEGKEKNSLRFMLLKKGRRISACYTDAN